MNRKMLSQVAIEDPKLFDQLAKMAEAGLAGVVKKAPARKKTASKPKPKPKPKSKPKAEAEAKVEAEPQPDAAPSA